MARIAAAVWSLLCLFAASFMTAQTPPCPIRSLAIDPSNTSVLYAIGAGGLFASSDGGAAWRLLYSGVSFPGFSQTLTIDQRDSQHIFLSTGTALVESRDSGRNWTELAVPQYPGFAILLGLSGVAIDRFDGSLCVVAYTRPFTGIGTRLNYLYKSVDGGQTWSSLLLGDPGMTAPILDRSSAGRLLVGVYGRAEGATDPPGGSLSGGILMSRDGGLTWSNRATFSPWCTDLVADSVDSNSLYAVVMRDLRDLRCRDQLGGLPVRDRLPCRGSGLGSLGGVQTDGAGS